MRLRMLVKDLLFYVAVGSSVLAGVRLLPEEAHHIWIDAGKPSTVEAPFEIAKAGENGELVLRIAPNVGRGWRGEAGGEATYRFEAPASGEYCIWALCLWGDECTNAVYVEIGRVSDDRDAPGAAPTTQHWEKGPDWRDTCAEVGHVQGQQLSKAVIGNDPVYNQWHWVRGWSIRLDQGPHVLRLSNHSDGMAVARLLLTNSPATHPDDL